MDIIQIKKRGEPYSPKNWNWIKFKLFVDSLLNRLPPLKRLFLQIWKNMQILRYKWVKWVSKKIAGHGNRFDADKLYWIDPKEIRYSSSKEFNGSNYQGRIIGGDWDQLSIPFEHLDVYVAFKERFIEGKAWEDTLFYKHVLDEIENGKFLWGCKNKSDFDRRCRNLESLFQDIKNNGYKTQSQILSEKNEYDPMKIEDEIMVNIGRRGHLLSNNGVHRLAIAKLLGIKKIPVKINVVHPEWINSRKGQHDLIDSSISGDIKK